MTQFIILFGIIVFSDCQYKMIIKLNKVRHNTAVNSTEVFRGTSAGSAHTHTHTHTQLVKKKRK